MDAPLAHAAPSPTAARWLPVARLGWFLVAGLVAVTLVALAPIHVATIQYDWRIDQVVRALPPGVTRAGFANYFLALRYGVLAIFLVTAVVIFWRRSDDPAALVTSLALLTLPLGFHLGGYTETWGLYPAPWRPFFQLTRDGLTALVAMPGLAALFFLFPDGRGLPAWARGPGLSLGAVLLLFGTFATLAPLAGWQDPDGQGWGLWMLTLLAALAVGLASQVYRYRRISSPLQRQQTRLVVFALAGFMLSFLLALAGAALLEDTALQAHFHLIELHLQLTAMAFIPVSLAVSIMCYRLWDIDLLLNRALVYGGLSLLIVSLYIVGVGVASRTLEGQGALAFALLALVIAGLLAAPLRRRLQRLADRWVPPAAPPTPVPEERAPTRVFGLAAARLGWLLFLAAAMAAYWALTPGPWTLLSEWLIQESLGALRGLVTMTAFAQYLALLRHAIALVAFLTAALLFWRRPHDRMAVFTGVFLASLPLGLHDAEVWRRYLLPWRVLLEAAQQASLLLTLFGLPLFLLLFPDGRFSPRWLRWVALGYLAAIVVFFGLDYVAPGLAWPGWQAWMAALIITVGLATAGQVHRYRRVSTPLQRQQTKWIVAAMLSVPVWLAAGLLMTWAEGTPAQPYLALFVLHAQLGVMGLLPLSVGFSLLRHRLWNVDLILNRALVYGALMILILAAYAAGVGLLSALAQAAGDVVLSIVITGLVAILFSPLRERLQRAANRLMYGERDDPATALSRLGQRLEATPASQAVLPGVAEAVAQALRLPYAAVELAGGVAAASVGRLPGPADGCLRLPIIYRAEAIGHLVAAPRAPGEPFTPADRRLLEDLARQAGPALHNVRLTADLQRSRERIVAAREEERRRLRRDLHDGLGPTLASQTFKLDAALDLLEAEPVKAAAYLREVKAQTQATVAEIRRLVYELRPPALDELGLVSALREHARQVIRPGGGLRVIVEAPKSLPPLPAAVEVAAYRISLEALTNVVKHARARVCRLELKVADWRGAQFLTLEVTDDGVGLAEGAQPGVGLASMRERAEELGGTCLVVKAPAGGVRLLAQLPITGGPAASEP